MEPLPLDLGFQTRLQQQRKCFLFLGRIALLGHPGLPVFCGTEARLAWTLFPGFSACLGWTQSAQIKVSSPHFYEINFSGSLLVIRCLGRKCERGQPINPQRKSGGREERETPWIENFQVTHSKKILVTNKKDPSPAARMVCRSVCPSLQALPSACIFRPISGRREA